MFVHGDLQIFCQGVELGIRHFHVFVHIIHRTATVLAGAATELAKLLGQHGSQPLHIGFLELLFDAGIIKDYGHEGIDENADTGFASQALVQGIALRLGLGRQSGAQQDSDQ